MSVGRRAHTCLLPVAAEEGEPWTCRCGRRWVWSDAHRVGSDFMSGWIPTEEQQ